MSAENNTITIGEFKSWLQGIKDMLGDDWTPNAEQWKRICEKIEKLKDTKVVEAKEPPLQYAPSPRPQFAAAPADMLGAGQPAPAQAAPAALSMHPAPRMPAPAQPANLRGPIATGTVGSNVGMPVKTPSIDTSGGKYDSAFE